MIRIRRGVLWLVPCAAVAISAASTVFWRGSGATFTKPSAGATAPVPSKAVDWYAPGEADFRPEYERDEANRKVQTWDQYWGWVVSMYSGNSLSAGWTELAKGSVAAVTVIHKRHKLVETLNELGKHICKEWAKDNKVRKITTSDLRRWHTMLATARCGEDGSGECLTAAIHKIRTEVTNLMQKDRAAPTLRTWLSGLKPRLDGQRP